MLFLATRYIAPLFHCVLVAAAVFAAAFSFHITSLENAEADTQILPRSNTTKFILVLGKISHFFLYLYSISVHIEDNFCDFGIFGQIWFIYYVHNLRHCKVFWSSTWYEVIPEPQVKLYRFCIFRNSFFKNTQIQS